MHTVQYSDVRGEKLNNAHPYQFFTVFAWIMVIVYPIGLPSYFFFSLWVRRPRRHVDPRGRLESTVRWARRLARRVCCCCAGLRWWAPGAAAVHSSESEMTERLFNEVDAEWVPDEVQRRTRGFLFMSYEPEMYYFECIDLIRKVIFTSLVVLIAPGTATQLVLVMLMSFAVIILLAARSFADRRRDARSPPPGSASSARSPRERTLP